MEIAQRIKEGLKDKISDWYEHSPRRIYFSLAPQNITEAARLLFQDLKLRFCTASGIHTPGGFEILYHFSHDKSGVIFSIRVYIEDKEKPEIESISPTVKAAEWIEREIHETLGVNFLHHPKLEHLILAEDWPEGKYPLRQDGS